MTSAAPASGLGWPDGTGEPSSGLGWAPRVDEITTSVFSAEAEVSRETQRTARVGHADVSRETTTIGQPPQEEVTPDIAGDPMTTPLAREVAHVAQRRRALATARTARPSSPRVVTVANQKGGVGKTTTAVNLGAALAQLGMRVLVIDMDPQGNASTALGVPHHRDIPGVYDVLIDGIPLRDVVQPSSSVSLLWCAPATIDLAGAEIELVPLEARERRLETALHEFMRDQTGEDRLDFVLIDCPPSLGLLTVNSFVAAQEVLIPIQCEYYALEGVSQLVSNIELITQHLNPRLVVSTVLLTMYDARTRLSAQVAEEVRAHFPAQTLQTQIPRSVRISEAPSHAETVLTYDPNSSGALSYREVAVEMTAVIEEPQPGAVSSLEGVVS